MASATDPLAGLTGNKFNTFGAPFVGFGFSCLLLGTLSTQMYTYFRRYPQDRPFYKGLVAALWALEVIDQVFIGYAVYFYVVTSWGDLSILFDRPQWSLILQVTLGATAGAIVKACFAMRVWRFSNNNVWVTGLIILLTVSQLAMACVYTAESFGIANLLHLAQVKVVGSISLALGVATDIVTAGALCFFLRNLRTGYSKDDSLVNNLTLYAVNTGVLTSAVSLTTLILYDLMPEDFIFMGFYFVVSKLYANSFLATLNTRRVLRGRGTDGEQATMPTFLMVGKDSKNAPNADPEATAGTILEVDVHKEVTVTRDSFHHSRHQYAVGW
ncbi:hypothetical protein POSPLADRAFT_1059065 [Postia placenta MAD-698-R-SB12]|uniref:DUF6534 domain-containing protein n=1 Tax=Postia placenta MAD-698-R-SB12 TaxID=670580 RepID=A0A1X6MTQ4_9APHY|nr:hypothetical protein POSPLADRAFT_1059065 [Postia placenta MAD-698-R-SB12]OSX59764.1 hypothetical protein POSPLADRAFT_1059065 [Postia placenta MAD-698-R-SB12]